MTHHRSNQTKPSQVNFGLENESSMMPTRPDIVEDLTQPKTKRAKFTPAVPKEETVDTKKLSSSQKMKDKRQDKR